MQIIKLGGSLITHKNSYCEIDQSEVWRFGRELKHALEHGAELPVIILGGGSFGNAIPSKYALNDSAMRRAGDISRMTVGMFSLMQQVLDIWRECGIPAFPIQANAVVASIDGSRTIDFTPFRAAMRHGLIPVTTGDILLEAQPVIFSSDYMPVLIAQETATRRVVMMTDVAGVQDRSQPGAPLLEVIRLQDRSRVLALAGASEQADVTGGMRTKVIALFELLERNVESVVVDGRRAGMLAAILMGESVSGSCFRVPVSGGKH